MGITTISRTAWREPSAWRSSRSLIYSPMSAPGQPRFSPVPAPGSTRMRARHDPGSLRQVELTPKAKARQRELEAKRSLVLRQMFRDRKMSQHHHSVAAATALEDAARARGLEFSIQRGSRSEEIAPAIDAAKASGVMPGRSRAPRRRGD